MEDIVADYALSLDPERDEILARSNTSVREVISSTLEGLQIDRYLGMGGVSQGDMAAVRRRLLG